jgi:hypothetical protein
MAPIDGMFRPSPRDGGAPPAEEAEASPPAHGEEMYEVRPVEDGTPLPAGDRKPIFVLDGRDVELEQELAAEEGERKRAERDAGMPVEGVEYVPSPEVPKWRIAATVVVALLVVLVLYYLVVPRASADVVIRYNEGLLGGINVDARIENHGTRAIEAATITITVQNSTDSPVGGPARFDGRVGAHSKASMDAISFKGDQWETYHIFVSWDFDCAGKHYSGSDYFSTGGDEMNVWFTKKIA